MGATPPAGSQLTESRLYPDGGYAVLHSARWQALFDAGPLGLGSLARTGMPTRSRFGRRWMASRS
jgi:hypothetical protein